MNGVAKITIDGREVALKFGLPAVRRILEKMAQYELSDDGIYSDLGLSHVLYAGYLNGCVMKDEMAEMPFETFYNHVENLRDDETSKEQVQAAVKAFEESRYIKPLVEKLKEETEKKSLLTGMGSNLSASESLDLNPPNTTD